MSLVMFFSPYSKAINKAYEEYVLSVGNLDERIFLGEDAEEEIGTLSRCLNSGSGTETAERVQMKNILQQHFDKVSWPGPGERKCRSRCAGCFIWVRVCMLYFLQYEKENAGHT